MFKPDLIENPQTVEDRLTNIDRRIEHLTYAVYSLLGFLGAIFYVFVINR